MLGQYHYLTVEIAIVWTFHGEGLDSQHISAKLRKDKHLCVIRWQLECWWQWWWKLQLHGRWPYMGWGLCSLAAWGKRGVTVTSQLIVAVATSLKGCSMQGPWPGQAVHSFCKPISFEPMHWNVSPRNRTSVSLVGTGFQPFAVHVETRWKLGEKAVTLTD